LFVREVLAGSCFVLLTHFGIGAGGRGFIETALHERLDGAARAAVVEIRLVARKSNTIAAQMWCERVDR